MAENDTCAERSGLITFISKDGAISQEISVTQSAPTNKIAYTSSDGKIVVPYQTAAFGAKIVSNVYENGKGVITFDGDVTSIGYYAFSDCDALKSVTIPDSVTTIELHAFYDCDALQSITIPNSVTSIGSYTFYGCDALTNVYCKATTPPNQDSAFKNTHNLINIYVPSSSVNAYKSAWVEYADKIVGYDF